MGASPPPLPWHSTEEAIRCGWYMYVEGPKDLCAEFPRSKSYKTDRLMLRKYFKEAPAILASWFAGCRLPSIAASAGAVLINDDGSVA